MKRKYKVGNETIEFGELDPKIIGFHPDTGAPVFEGQIIEEKRKNFLYVHTTPKDRIISILINILLGLAISFLIFIPVLSNFDITIFISISYPIICAMFVCNIGMLVTGLHIINPNKKKTNTTILSYKAQYRPLILRLSSALLTFLIPFGPIISLICLFKTEKHQMLHDILLNQYVVKKIK